MTGVSWRRMTVHQKLDELHRQLAELRRTLITTNSNLVIGLGTIYATINRIEERLCQAREEQQEQPPKTGGKRRPRASRE